MPLEHPVGTITIVAAQWITVVIPELELGKIAGQMLLSAELIDALYTALENAEIALDGVAVDRAILEFR